MDASAQQAGGYDALGQTAKNRQQSLQSSINSYRSQLQQAYRNEALVLRDAGRISEALDAAQSALGMATDTERPTVQQLIDDLKKQTTG